MYPLSLLNRRVQLLNYTKRGEGAKAFDVNTRSAYAMRSCGLGYNALEIFCGLMNLPPPIAKNNYQKVSKKNLEARDIAESSMLSAICEFKEKEGTDIGVSVDGTWQRKGFSSLNGVVVAVSTTNFQVVDVEIRSRYCQPCTSKEELRKTDKIAFDKWKIDLRRGVAITEMETENPTRR